MRICTTYFATWKVKVNPEIIFFKKFSILRALEKSSLNETKLTYDIKVHTAEEIQAVRESLPSLGPLARAMKIHEILITADGVIKSKFLPSDVYYDHVKIAVSRRHKRVESIGENGEDI